MNLTDGAALRISTEGVIKVIPYDGRNGAYNTLRDAVGGYIEAVTLNVAGIHLIMWINEEGKLNNLEHNPVASSLAWDYGYLSMFDNIVGDVIITSGEVDGDGRDRGLTPNEGMILLERVVEIYDQEVA